MNDTIIKEIEVFPIAVPATGFGADPKNKNPVYGAAVLKLQTSDPHLVGDSFVFTIGHGTQEMCHMIRSVAHRFLWERPLAVEALLKSGRLGAYSRSMLADSDYNWLGGAGMSRMAIGAVINGLWDLCAKKRETTGWEFLARQSPEDLLEFIDFEHVGDFLSSAEALTMLRDAQDGKEARISKLYESGPAAYNTAGWSGVTTDHLAAKTREMLARGWPLIKLKVGAKFPTQGMEVALREDIARLTGVFNTIHQLGGSMKVAVDSNQIFNVNDAVEFISRLALALHKASEAKGARYQLAWFEEPTSPLDSQGHLMIKHALKGIFAKEKADISVPIATGEHCPAPVIFKNLVKGIPELGVAPIDVIQLDYSRMGGIGDLLTTMLMARKTGVRICPHAGGVGLCEGAANVQALKEALFGEQAGEVLEFVEGGLHEGIYKYPASVKGGHYSLHRGPIGNATELTVEGVREYGLPDGNVWRHPANQALAARLSATP